MKKPKPQKIVSRRTDSGPLLVMARQTTEEIQRRQDIREALHDLKAKTLRKTR